MGPTLVPRLPPGHSLQCEFCCSPYLLDAASKWQPSQRLMPLELAAAIVASWDVKGSRDQLIAEHLTVVGELHKLTLETLASTAFAQNHHVYLVPRFFPNIDERK